MSRLFSPRNLAVAGGVGALVFFWPAKATQSSSSSASALPGVQNIADRYSSGGGTTSHAPGYATKRGDPSDTTSRSDSHAGVGSQKFADGHGDQKVGEPGVVGKAWNEMHHGNEKGR